MKRHLTYPNLTDAFFERTSSSIAKKCCENGKCHVWRRCVPGDRIAASDGLHPLSAGCHSIDKQAAPGDHTIAGRKTVEYLDRVAIREPGLDPPQLDRFFIVLVAHDPDPGGFALVNNGIARDRDRVVAFAGEDLHARKHFRLEQTGGIVDGRAHQQPPDAWIE